MIGLGNYVATNERAMGDYTFGGMSPLLAIAALGVVAWVLWPRQSLRRNPTRKVREGGRLWGDTGPSPGYSLNRTIASTMNKKERKKFGKIFWAAKGHGARSSTAYDIALKKTVGSGAAGGRFIW